MLQLFRQLFEGKNDFFLVAIMVGVLVVLFTPIPPAVLDVLLILNFSLALLFLLLTFYTDKPLSFSTFPSLLLIATLFRLALNISATRLILNDADAGNVIGAVGSYVVGGNYVVGMVVFLILVVVQYVVVTNGAQRVAEVAARFTLDSMPGKQMSIDADLNMGLIDEHEAKDRRKAVEKEANFYGAMDGATKFVKGDAIAGIIIILIDIIGGLSIGIAQHGMSWGEALRTYTLLTVGDGIVTQIPSLVIAVATGILITRAATDAQLGQEVVKQFSNHPRTLLIVGISLLFFMMLPGLPKLPIFIITLGFFVLAFYAAKLGEKATDEEEKEQQETEKESNDIYAQMAVAPIAFVVGEELGAYLNDNTKDVRERLGTQRKQYALDNGFVVPEPKFTDSKDLPGSDYEVLIFGSRVGGGTLRFDKIMAINPGGKRPTIEGESAKEPTYGLPAVWINEEQSAFARSAGYTLVDPDTILITHFGELMAQFAPELLTRSQTENLIDRLRPACESLIDELVPNVLAYSDIQQVLQNLLKEKVSIRNLEQILEVLVDKGKEIKDAATLTELVRQKLGRSICQGLTTKSGELTVLTFDAMLERTLINASGGSSAGQFMMDPQVTDSLLRALIQQCEKMMANNLLPVLLCSAQIRRQVKLFADRVMPHLAVISLTEVPTTAKVKSFAVVNIENLKEMVGD